jgi:T-complex protein 1 subunit alpha
MASKIIGSESNFFAELAVNAALKVKTEPKASSATTSSSSASTVAPSGEDGYKGGKVKCHINNIHILKSHGLSLLNSELIDGYALNCTRAASAMPSRLEGLLL